jgi:hypothetical protein
MAKQPTPLDRALQPPRETHQPSHGQTRRLPMVPRHHGLLARITQRQEPSRTRLTITRWASFTGNQDPVIRLRSPDLHETSNLPQRLPIVRNHHTIRARDLYMIPKLSHTRK